MLVRRQFASARKEEEEEVVDILHDSDGELPDLKFEPVVIENESKCGRKRKGWWHEMSSDEEESIVRDLRDRELFEKMERLIYQEEQQKKEQIKSKSWMQKIRRTQQELKRDQSFQQFLNANVFDPDEDDMVDEIPDPQYQGKDGKACRNSKPPPSVYRDLNEPDGYNDEISRVYWKKYNEDYIVCDDWEWPDLEILSKKARSLLSLEKKYLKKMKMAQKRANKCVSGREDSPELIRNGHIGTEYSCLNGSQELINGSLSPTPTPSPQSPMNESAQGSPMNDMSPRFSPQSPIFPSSTHSGTNEPHSSCNGKLFVNKICATSAIDLLIQVAKSKEKNPEKKEVVRKQPTLSAETLKLLPCRYAREETSGGFR